MEEVEEEMMVTCRLVAFKFVVAMQLLHLF